MQHRTTDTISPHRASGQLASSERLSRVKRENGKKKLIITLCVGGAGVGVAPFPCGGQQQVLVWNAFDAFDGRYGLNMRACSLVPVGVRCQWTFGKS